jgi:uncharacterized protein with PIN domain
VGVPCPQCGRQYDATLFEFGRTLWCACGGRVAMEPRVRSLRSGAESRFFADAMLGRLARWLRILGFDCAYESAIADAELVRRAAREERVILSRDRALPEEWRISGIQLLESEGLVEQIREVVRAFDLGGAVRIFSRCNECNEPLRAAAKAEVAGRVPPRILATQEAFRECPACGRVYWEGSHTEHMRRAVDAVLAGC